jgi:hypothetical protein
MSNIGPTGPTGQNGYDFQIGKQGLPGATGPVGPQGPPGKAEYKGDKGDLGPRGPTGNTGSTGPTGPTGAVGAASTSVNTFRYKITLPSGSAVPKPGQFRFSDTEQIKSTSILLNSINFVQDASGNDISDQSGNNISGFLETINEYASSDKYGYLKIQSVIDYNKFMIFKIVKAGVVRDGLDDLNNNYYKIDISNVTPGAEFDDSAP